MHYGPQEGCGSPGMVVLHRICSSYVQRTVFRGISAESGWLTCLFLLDVVADMDALSHDWGVFWCLSVAFRRRCTS